VQNVYVGRGRIGGDAGQEWYCCYIGLFGSPAEAWGWRDQVRQWGFYDAYVTRLQAGRLAEALHTCRGAG
jgi:hypothetical protein